MYITRICTINGEWDNVDYSSCTMRLEALPLIMVEVKDFDSLINTTSIVNQVRMWLDVCDFMFEV